MLSPGTITTIEYDAARLRLRVAFDSNRVIVFYRVPPTIAEMLVDSEQPEQVLETHIVGRFGWTEIGALGAPELARIP
jgi:hypothetical protein